MSAVSPFLIMVLLVLSHFKSSDQSQVLDGYSYTDENDLLKRRFIESVAAGGVEQSGPSNKSLKDNSNCHALPTEIHVTKEETDESGNVVRVCEGTIRVAKCEGTCHSELRPSVHSPTGFAKVIVSSN